MLPWFKMDTMTVIRHRNLRIAQGRKASDIEGMMELCALLAAGALDGMSHNAAAQTLGWTRKKVSRVCAEMPLETMGQVGGPELPKWWATGSKQSRLPTKEEGQVGGKLGASWGHTRARSSLKKKKEKKTTHVSKPPVLPFKVGRSIDAGTLSSEVVAAWAAYTAEGGPFPGATLTKPALGHLQARLAEHGAALTGVLIPWLMSDHERAVFLRVRGDTETPLRASNCERYLDMAQREASAAPSVDTDAMIAALRRAVTSGATADLAPALLAAVDACGGMTAYRRANDYEANRLERQIAKRLRGAA